MTRLPCLVAIQQLEVPQAPADEVKSLRQLKNDIVGHGLRKELAVKHGVLAHLARILSTSTRTSGKRSVHQANGASNIDAPASDTQWTTEDEARLQATLVLGVLANGGPSFVQPILASNALPALVDALTPGVSGPKIVRATLQTLINVASSWALTDTSPTSKAQSPVTSQIFTKSMAHNLLALLQQPLSTSSSHQQLSLVTGLIATACTDDSTRSMLADDGILDALATLLCDNALNDLHTSGDLPDKLMGPSTLANLMNALSSIVTDSDSGSRVSQLALSPAMLPTSNKHHRLGARTINGSTDVMALDHQLPKALTVASPSAAFAAHASHAFAGLSRHAEYTSERHPASGVDSLCSRLRLLARSQRSSISRLAALRLLAIVSAASDPPFVPRLAGGVGQPRYTETALLAVPLAVKLVQDAVTAGPTAGSLSSDNHLLAEGACATLALLVGGSKELQKAAVDAGAIKHVCQQLRRSFDPIVLAKPMWSSQAHADSTKEHTSASARLGRDDIPQEVAHVMRVRAGALQALAAIAKREDTHRKTIIDQGVVNCLIDSLTPLSPNESAGESSPSSLRRGNTLNVVIAACETASALSRSVSLLRTSLIDAGIAKPILALLKHQDSAVQIAATNVSCNLVLDFSPMRQDLVDAGAIKTFCDHARRSNPALRLASLWALKHLVLNSPRAIKVEALDELGTGWLVQAISGERRADEIPSAFMGMSTANAAGEQVSLLNAPNSPVMDLDVPEQHGQREMGAMLGTGAITPYEDDDDDEDEHDDEEQAYEHEREATRIHAEEDDEGELYYDASGTPYQSSGLRSTLQPNKQRIASSKSSRERERRSNNDEEVQEQALDFVRNLINGEDAASMIDHLNAAIGVQRIFELLEAKLIGGHPRALSQSRQYPPAGWVPKSVVHSTVHIMNQISAASSRHKQLLIAQKPLLRAWLPHFGHPDSGIRAMSVWTVINLTWVEDQGDREDARRRAHELRTMGIVDKVRTLSGDLHLDVKERTKTAVRQLDELLAEGGRGR